MATTEVARSDRRLLRLNGKSDTLDAENAARAVLAGFVIAVLKSTDGAVEMIRQLKVALRPRGLNAPEDVNRHVLRSIAKRWIALNVEITELEAMNKDLVTQSAPHLLERFGIGYRCRDLHRRRRYPRAHQK